jgi:hypothetical protein
MSIGKPYERGRSASGLDREVKLTQTREIAFGSVLRGFLASPAAMAQISVPMKEKALLINTLQ